VVVLVVFIPRGPGEPFAHRRQRNFTIIRGVTLQGAAVGCRLLVKALRGRRRPVDCKLVEFERHA